MQSYQYLLLDFSKGYGMAPCYLPFWLSSFSMLSVNKHKAFLVEMGYLCQLKIWPTCLDNKMTAYSALKMYYTYCAS